MPNWLTITWEHDRLTLLAARVQGGTAVFEHAATLSLQTVGEESDEGKRPPSLKKQLNEFIQKNRLVKAETIVLLSRSDVEVRPMVFPPVPQEELPDLVKFQASKEFNAYDPNSPIDFFITNKLDNVSRSTLFPAVTAVGKTKTAPSGEAPKHLLASILRHDTYNKIRQFCEELNLTLRRIVLHPCESAYLLRKRKGVQAGRTILFVELNADELSQTVLFQGEPVFMRSPKIACPEDITAPDFVARLIAELKRTRIAVRNEIQGVTVDEVLLSGVGRHYDKLAAQIAKSLDIPAGTFDPWEGVSLGRGVREELDSTRTEEAERFAPLIGALVRAGKGEASDLDFCNPKKRPEPVGHRQMITGVLAASFFLLLCIIGYGFYARNTLDREVKSLTARLNSLQKSSRSLSVERTQLNAIDDWLKDNVDWFDQLGWLSRRAPDAKDMILNDLVMTANQGGSMALKALVRDSSVVSPMEDRFRDEKHGVKAGEKGEVKGNPFYGFRFNLSVFLSKESAAVMMEEPAPELKNAKESAAAVTVEEPVSEPKHTEELPQTTPQATPESAASPPSNVEAAPAGKEVGHE